MKIKLISIFLILIFLCLNLSARYYDPDTGRFTTADIATPGEGADSQGLNRYSYCDNNPVTYIDPSGNEATKPDSINVIVAGIKDEPTITPTSQIYEHEIMATRYFGFGAFTAPNKDPRPYFELYAGERHNILRFQLNSEMNKLESVLGVAWDVKAGNFNAYETGLTYDLGTGNFDLYSKQSYSLLNKEDVKKIGFNMNLYTEPGVVTKGGDVNLSSLKAGVEFSKTQQIGPVKAKGKLGLYEVYKRNKEGKLQFSKASNRLELSLSMDKIKLPIGQNYTLSWNVVVGKVDISINQKTGKLQVDKINPRLNVNINKREEKKRN